MMKYQTKAILAGFMGNFVEAYDVAICYYLSSELARFLMGSHQGDPRLIFILICIAYLVKPIGAFFLGLFSDQYGRKRVMTASIFFAGLLTAIIGFIPTYDTVGMASIILLLMARVGQGIAIGAEFLNSAAFLVESGNREQRGFRGCWSSVGVKVGSILACLAAEGAHLTALNFGVQYTWRIPFCLAIFTMIIGVVIRFRVPESLGYVLYYSKRSKPKTLMIYKEAFRFMRDHTFLFRFGFLASFLSVASSFFFFFYMPIHAVHISHFSREWVTFTTLVSLTFTAILIPLIGWFSDRNDRLYILTAATSGLVTLAYPFMLAVTGGEKSQLFIMQLLIAIPCAGYYSVCAVLLTELFPLSIRCTVLSITFSIAASLAAGLPPILGDLLIQLTGWANAPACIIMIMGAILLLHLKSFAMHYRLGRNHYRDLLLEESLRRTPLTENTRSLHASDSK